MRAIDPALFPNVVGALRDAGLDPTRERVPVAPAAHYTIGGVVTDLHARSGVPGLYAVGETACTGLHGANRLASNSLSECFVFGRRAALAALEEPMPKGSQARSGSDAPRSSPIVGVERATQRALWDHAGIERSERGLRELLDDSHPLARSIARAAIERKESRGTHARIDRPHPDITLDGKHVVTGETDEELCWETWE
jgi:L-aspartate oxidase